MWGIPCAKGVITPPIQKIPIHHAKENNKVQERQTSNESAISKNLCGFEAGDFVEYSEQMMRFVVDMQGAQTESRFRGIGRYTMDFVHALLRNRGEHEILLALSGLLPDSIDRIRTAFADQLPQENMLVWSAPGPVKGLDPDNLLSFQVAALLREAFLASLKPDVIHVTSLFEGFMDDAVTSIGFFGNYSPVSVILYDLIPLKNPKQYLDISPVYSAFYHRKIDFLRQAALYLTISDFSRREGIAALSEREDKFVNISSAVDPFFKPTNLSKPDAIPILKRLGIQQSFILTTGGLDDRKNLPRLIEAFAKITPSLRTQYQLVLVGKATLMHEVQLRRHAHSLGLDRNEMIITGYVDDHVLLQLYSFCDLYIFPSWHEGFGLPALEAMACGAPVIASNTTSLPEVIELDEALFDPFDILAMADKMADALQNEGFRQKLRSHSLKQAQKFTWDQTVQRAMRAWTEVSESTGLPKAEDSLIEEKLISALALKLKDADEATLASIAHHIALNQTSAQRGKA